MPEQPFHASPLLGGIVLVAAGAALMQVRPHLLDVPGRFDAAKSPRERLDEGDRLGAVAQEGRDRLLDFLPSNLFEWVGRGLITLGGLVVFTRLLDRLVDDEGMTGR